MKPIKLFLLFIISSPLLYAQPAGEFIPPKIQLTDSVFCTEIKDQGQSPTCWVFGTNSLFESDYFKKYNYTINLSEMFIARYAYIDKAKMYLKTKGRTYYKGGGQFHDVIRVVNNYGIVPQEVYRGIPDNGVSHNHAKLDTAMIRFARRLLRQGKKVMGVKELKQINDTLDRYLGKVPATFWYNLNQYNPQSFAKEVIGISSDYVEVMSFANLPLYKKCLLNDKFNWAGDSLYNISLDDMQMIVDTALAKGWSVGWEGDITEPGFNSLRGYAVISDTTQQFDETRLRDFKNETTERDHMLHLVGIGKDENNKKWYYLKNSWGIGFSHFHGYLFMEENYFKLKTVVLMINKSALPQELKEKLSLQ